MFPMLSDKRVIFIGIDLSKGWVLSLTILDSVLYMAGADERMLAAVNPNTGTEYWKRSIDF